MAATGLILTTGCAGRTVVKESKLEEMRTNASNQRKVIKSLRSDLDREQEDTEELEAALDDAEASVDRLEAELNDAENDLASSKSAVGKREIDVCVSLYNVAELHYETGIRSEEVAEDDADEQDWANALTRYSGAEVRYIAAINTLAEVEDTVGLYGFEAGDILSDAKAKCEARENAAYEMWHAIRARAYDMDDLENEYTTKAEEYLEEAEDYEFAPPGDLRKELQQ